MAKLDPLNISRATVDAHLPADLLVKLYQFGKSTWAGCGMGKNFLLLPAIFQSFFLECFCIILCTCAV